MSRVKTKKASSSAIRAVRKGLLTREPLLAPLVPEDRVDHEAFGRWLRSVFVNAAVAERSDFDE